MLYMCALLIDIFLNTLYWYKSLWTMCFTGRKGMNIQGHILLLCVSNIKKVSNDWSLRGISTEVQHHHTYYSEDNANWLAAWTITNGKA